jgi:hypothetical protein
MCNHTFTQVDCAHIITPGVNTTTHMPRRSHKMPTHHPARLDAIASTQNS